MGRHLQRTKPLNYFGVASKRVQTLLNHPHNTLPCESVSPSTSDRPVSRSVTPVGSSTASSTASSQMDRCPATRPSEAATTLSTPSSPRLVLASTCRAPYLSIWCELVPTDSSSTPNSSSPVRRMPPTTTPEVTTPSVRRSSTLCSTESESSPISALVFKVSSSSTPSVAVPVPDLPRFLWSDSPSTTARSPSSNLPSTPLPRSPRPSSSLTTRSSRRIPLWSTLTAPSW